MYEDESQSNAVESLRQNIKKLQEDILQFRANWKVVSGPRVEIANHRLEKLEEEISDVKIELSRYAFLRFTGLLLTSLAEWPLACQYVVALRIPHLLIRSGDYCLFYVEPSKPSQGHRCEESIARSGIWRGLVSSRLFENSALSFEGLKSKSDARHEHAPAEPQTRSPDSS